MPKGVLGPGGRLAPEVSPTTRSRSRNGLGASMETAGLGGAGGVANSPTSGPVEPAPRRHPPSRPAAGAVCRPLAEPPRSPLAPTVGAHNRCSLSTRRQEGLGRVWVFQSSGRACGPAPSPSPLGPSVVSSGQEAGSGEEGRGGAKAQEPRGDTGQEGVTEG